MNWQFRKPGTILICQEWQIFFFSLAEKEKKKFAIPFEPTEHLFRIEELQCVH